MKILMCVLVFLNFVISRMILVLFSTRGKSMKTEQTPRPEAAFGLRLFLPWLLRVP